MTNDKQTAEEAAREWFNRDVIQGGDKDSGIRSWLIWAGMNNGGDAIKKGYDFGFERGMKLAQEREKVLGERWVMISELDGLPIGFLYREKQEMQGYRAVKVKLVEQSESEGESDGTE